MSKPTVNYPAFYATLYPRLNQRAKELGWCLAIHGSMNRDFDLIAVPWVEEAVPETALVMALAEILRDDEPLDWVHPIVTDKPHGRRAWVISVGIGHMYLDLSVMPIKPKRR